MSVDGPGPDDPAASNISHARPLEVEEALNRRFVHPMSRALVRLLIPTGISPNAVSVLGVAMASLAAAAYAALAWPWNAVIGLLFHIAWHVFDGADGDLARRTGRSSPNGEIVDGICDHVSHLIIYVVLALILQRSIGAWAWPLSAASLASRAMQATGYETIRRNYRRWSYGVNWLRQELPRSAAREPDSLWRRFSTPLAAAYLRISKVSSADDRQIEAAMSRIMSAGGAPAAAARDLYRQRQRPMVRRAFWLSTNYETLAIFLSLLAGSPVYFLVFQLTVLNLVLAGVVTAQRRSYAALLVELDAIAQAPP